MLIVVAYDINTEDAAGQKRLRKVAKACVNKGQRVQASVFECQLNGAEYAALKHQLQSIIDRGKDSVRFYNLGDTYRNRIDAIGRTSTYEPDGLLLV